MTIHERLIWERDHSDALNEWQRYDRIAAQLESGLISETEAAQISGLVF